VAFKIVITEPALADLEMVMNWSLEKYPAASERFGIALLKHVELLKAFPFVGAPVKDLPGVRRLIHSPLSIYYRVLEDKEVIEILHFWHVARRAPTS
jgi:plasmid stabilization system protein ParE